MRPHNITVIQVYAPNSDYEDEEVEQLYKQLESFIAKTPKKNTLVVQSNWIAKIGPGAYQTLGRDSRKIWHLRDKRQRMWTLRVREVPPTHPYQHSTPTSCIEHNLAYP